jgi:hypothetical protein
MIRAKSHSPGCPAVRTPNHEAPGKRFVESSTMLSARSASIISKPAANPPFVVFIFASKTLPEIGFLPLNNPLLQI